jgi:ABC-type bacteriocin/lantibiotic exporter with double-glycine peptidase domain
VSLYFLAGAAAQIGFQPKATRSTVDQISKVRLPAIAHWDNRHYVVLYRVDAAGNEFVIGDPERGLLKLTRQQFEDGWSGRLLQLEPTARLEEHPQPDSMLKRLLMSIQNRVPGSISERLASANAESEHPKNEHSANIRLENVSFRFSPDGSDVPSGVNLEVRAGQTVAIVGRSGAGKSLLAWVLQGSITPTSGQLLVDGKTLAPGDCRRPFRYSQLLQDRDLFDGLTIAENIALGSNADPADRKIIIAAAELAEADSFIKRLPYGYDTPIGNGFAQLSAGEGQLLSLARASLMDAPLLVMDDSLSALSSDQARRVLLRLRNSPTPGREHRPAGRRTFIVTSRNVAAVRDADVIAVLDDGHLVESGKHQDLIARDGLYSFLWREHSR